MARFFLEVMYDGTAFHGSQLQGETGTVQLEINKALSTLLRKEVLSFGASRTDEGVHALGNFYHFDYEEELHPKFQYQLNAVLPFTIAVRNIYKCAEDSFNARFDAVSRSYRYKVYSRRNPFYVNRALYYPFKIDTEVLHQTAAIILEYQDFESFCKRNSNNFTYFCSIFESRWETNADQLHYVVKANRFLRGMVRGLVSTQLQVARGRFSIKDFRNIIEDKDCTKADFSVPGHGLYLEEIAYPQDKLDRLFLI